MPGFEKSCFINLSKNEDLMCSICYAIFHNPMVTPCCRQTYCADCINHWLEENNTCPNDRKKLLLKDLRRAPLLVYNLLLKLEECSSNPNKICNDCNHKIGNKNEHNCLDNLKTDIEYLKVKCFTYETKFKKSDEKCKKLFKNVKLLSYENNSIKERNKEIEENYSKIKDISYNLTEKIKRLTKENLILQNDQAKSQTFKALRKSIDDEYVNQSDNFNKRRNMIDDFAIHAIEFINTEQRIENNNNSLGSQSSSEKEVSTISKSLVSTREWLQLKNEQPSFLLQKGFNQGHIIKIIKILKEFISTIVNAEDVLIKIAQELENYMNLRKNRWNVILATPNCSKLRIYFPECYLILIYGHIKIILYNSG